MDNASRTDESVHANWVEQVDRRIGELAATGDFNTSDPKWVPIRLIALASGYMREVPSPGRRRNRLEFRIELLDRDLRTSLAPGTEWLTVSQITELTKISRPAVAREYEEWAALLYIERDKVAVIDGEIIMSVDCLSSKAKAGYYGEKGSH